MDPDSFGSKEWKYIMGVMKQHIENGNNKDKVWCIFQDKEAWDNVGVFQFDSKNQKARLSFNAEEDNPFIADIDFQDPKATGLAVIAAFTKMVLND